MSPPRELVVAVRRRDLFTCQMCGEIQGGRHDPNRRPPTRSILSLWPPYDPTDNDPDHYCVICLSCLWKVTYGLIPDLDGVWHDRTLYPSLPEGDTPSHRYGTFLRRDKVLSKRWRAYIWNGTKTIHLGSYWTQDEAARAYDVKARELFGDRAKLNFPDDTLSVTGDTQEEDNPKEKVEGSGLLVTDVAQRTD